MDHYLPRILRARVYDVARETPLEPAVNLSERLDNTIWLKREDLQPVFSFKLRGAYNRMAQLSPEQLSRGVIASSAGNHAQGVALSAQHLGCRAVIVMPITTPKVKVDAVRRRGGTVVLVGNVSPAIELPLQAVVTRQLRLQGSCASAGCYPEAIRLVAEGRVDLSGFVSRVAPLAEGPDWFCRLKAREEGLVKVVLEP